jgi:hypothetical protein
MFKYRVISWRTTGNSLRVYTILDMETNETFETYAKFFKEQGDDAFINVRVGSSFNILRKDKEVEVAYKTDELGNKIPYYREKKAVPKEKPAKPLFVRRPIHEN